MNWWGKLVGGAFGFMLGGPLGALLGVAIGSSFDKGLRGAMEGPSPDFGPGEQERVQTAFFTATFSVMGYLAKVDGRVSEDEIRLAREVMAQMSLSSDLKQTAMRLFTEGKQPGFPLDGVIDQFRRECHRRRNLMQMFIEIQLHVAYADGVMHDKERRVLLGICERLGFTPSQFQQLEAMVQAARHFSSGGYQAQASPASLLKDAYDVLGVQASSSDDEIKKAYRRLTNQHHPDKLVAKGLPEEMIKLATEKTQEIRKAYEIIRDERRKNK